MSVPQSHFIQFSVKAPSPSGYRHIDASGIKIVDTSASGALNFGTLNNGSGIIVTSPTKCVVWVIDSMGDATEQIFDMKFWLSSVSDFTGLGTDYNVYFNKQMSTAWQSGLKIDYSDGDFVGITIPSGQNLLSSSGTTSIVGAGQDFNTSQYIYLSISADPDVPVGTYGGDGVGTFRYRVTYKYI